MAGSGMASLVSHGLIAARPLRRTSGTPRTNGTRLGRREVRCRSRASKCGSKVVTMVVLRNAGLVLLAPTGWRSKSFSLYFGV